MRRLFLLTLAFVFGVVAGGVLLGGSQRRSFAAVGDCQGNCYKPSDLAGLLVSAGIRLAPSSLPKLVRETDRCVAIAHPSPQAPVHFVLFPKRDIKHIADISTEDGSYVLGCFDLVRALVNDQHIRNYRLATNGPDLQLVTYLHWHLTGSK
jgi:hypothetical protein